MFLSVYILLPVRGGAGFLPLACELDLVPLLTNRVWRTGTVWLLRCHRGISQIAGSRGSCCAMRARGRPVERSGGKEPRLPANREPHWQQHSFPTQASDGAAPATDGLTAPSGETLSQNLTHTS